MINIIRRIFCTIYEIKRINEFLKLLSSFQGVSILSSLGVGQARPINILSPLESQTLTLETKTIRRQRTEKAATFMILPLFVFLTYSYYYLRLPTAFEFYNISSHVLESLSFGLSCNHPVNHCTSDYFSSIIFPLRFMSSLFIREADQPSRYQNIFFLLIFYLFLQPPRYFAANL